MGTQSAWPASSSLTGGPSRTSQTTSTVDESQSETATASTRRHRESARYAEWRSRNLEQIAVIDTDITNDAQLLGSLLRGIVPQFQLQALPSDSERGDATSSATGEAEEQARRPRAPRFHLVTEQQVLQHLQDVHRVMQRHRAEGQAVGRDEVYAALMRSEYVTSEVFAEGVRTQQYYAYEIAASRQELATTQRQLEMVSESAAQVPQAIAGLQGDRCEERKRACTVK